MTEDLIEIDKNTHFTYHENLYISNFSVARNEKNFIMAKCYSWMFLVDTRQETNGSSLFIKCYNYFYSLYLPVQVTMYKTQSYSIYSNKFEMLFVI